MFILSTAQPGFLYQISLVGCTLAPRSSSITPLQGPVVESGRDISNIDGRLKATPDLETYIIRLQAPIGVKI